MIPEDFVLGAQHIHGTPRAPVHPRGSLGVAQEAPGGRSGRFRTRTDALSDPKHCTNSSGKFHFSIKFHHFSGIGLWRD